MEIPQPAEIIAKQLVDPKFVGRMHRVGMSKHLNTMTEQLSKQLPANNAISQTANKAKIARNRVDTITTRLMELERKGTQSLNPLEKMEYAQLLSQILPAQAKLNTLGVPGLNGGKRKQTRAVRRASKKSKKTRRNRK